MIDWIKFTVGFNLFVLNVAIIVFWIVALYREWWKGTYSQRVPKKRIWMNYILTFIAIVWLFIMPLISTIYRHTVVFYARMTYSDSTVLCNELKDYGYICTEDKNKVIQK